MIKHSKIMIPCGAFVIAIMAGRSGRLGPFVGEAGTSEVNRNEITMHLGGV